MIFTLYGVFFQSKPYGIIYIYSKPWAVKENQLLLWKEKKKKYGVFPCKWA